MSLKTPSLSRRRPSAHRSLGWPDHVDEIIASDQVVALAYATPAGGVVVMPVTNFGLRDRSRGVVAPISSSIGMWRKLEQIRQRPRIAVAFHTREHGASTLPHCVLIQGEASLTPLEDRGWIAEHLEAWERFAGSRDVGPLWERWLSVYHWRVGIELAVERIVAWPSCAARGAPKVYGAPLPPDPALQQPPPRGATPRIRPADAAERAERLPNLLLGWLGADGFPFVLPVELDGADEHGIVLDAAKRAIPLGGRRAGLTAHSFARFAFGLHQRRHSGWLNHDAGGRLVFAPHTAHAQALPSSRFLYRVAAGLVTQRGLYEARTAGFFPHETGVR